MTFVQYFVWCCFTPEGRAWVRAPTEQEKSRSYRRALVDAGAGL